MDAADFPYDVQWTDIDAMSEYRDFTYDETDFKNLPDLVRSLQSSGKHYVNIIDPGISSNQTAGKYSPYDEGVERGIFMRKFNSSEFIIGKVENEFLSIDHLVSSLLGLARSYCFPGFYSSECDRMVDRCCFGLLSDCSI